MIADLKPYPEYKESGLPWLGRVPAHWGQRRMKFLFKEISQKGYPNEPLLAATQSKGVVRKEDYGLRTVTAMNGLENLKLVEVGDFVISLRSFQGGIEVSHARGIISPAYTVLRPYGGFEPRFFSSYFKSADFIRSLTLFVTGIREGQNIDYERLSRAFVPLPPPDEQAAIVHFLDWANGRLERAIRAKRKIIALLNEQKQAIIHRAVTRGLDPNVPLKPSGIPWLDDIPQHWEVIPLKSVCNIVGRIGFRGYTTADLVEPGLGALSLSPGELRGGRISTTKSRYISFRKYEESPEIKVFAGDVLLVKTGSTTGKVAQVESLVEPATINPQLVVLKMIKGNSRFLAHSIASGYVQAQVRMNMIGGSTPTITQAKIASFKIAQPSSSEQDKIVEHIHVQATPVFATISRLEREIELLREYGTRLVADVVTGKLDVRAAAAKLPDEAPLEAVEEEALSEDETEIADEEAIE